MKVGKRKWNLHQNSGCKSYREGRLQYSVTTVQVNCQAHEISVILQHATESSKILLIIGIHKE